MKFVKILEKLKNEYGKDIAIQKNGTVLLGPGNIPNCQHELFAPLSKEIIKEYLVDECNLKFPQEYIEFLQYFNGANLCTVKVQLSGFEIAHSMLVIFGLPKKPPHVHPKNEDEPFDLRIEDSARHPEIPETWLKCGTFVREENLRANIDIFIDTITEQVYACEKNQKEVLDHWPTLDACFCAIWKSLEHRKPCYKLD